MSTLVRQLLFAAAAMYTAASAVAGEIILFEYLGFGGRRIHEQYPYDGPPTSGSPR